MAAMVALQTSLSSFSLSSNSFFGRPLPTPSLLSVPGNSPQKPCIIEAMVKRWEVKKWKRDGRPIVLKMHVKVGDTVLLISGREKGKIGEITKIFKYNSTVIVEGMNLKTKHKKSTTEGEPGEIVKIEGAIHSSNVMLYSTEKEVASRIGKTVLENGKRVRYLLKTGEIIDSEETWEELRVAKRAADAAE